MRRYVQGRDVIETIYYPSGETHHQIQEGIGFYHRRHSRGEDERWIIEYHARNWGDLMGLVLCDQRFKELRVPVRWFVPFLPFARDDRRRSKGCTAGLDYAIDLLKPLDILIADPHSYVSERLPYVPQATLFNIAMNETDIAQTNPLVVIPDEGARKKADTWLRDSGLDFVQAEKSRDPETGRLSGFGIREPDRVKGRACLIVDDICDGGGTFIGLEECLENLGADHTKLIVTHGLFTNGTSGLMCMDQIVTFGDGGSGNWITRIPWETVYKEAIGHEA